MWALAYWQEANPTFTAHASPLCTEVLNIQVFKNNSQDN